MFYHPFISHEFLFWHHRQAVCYPMFRFSFYHLAFLKCLHTHMHVCVQALLCFSVFEYYLFQKIHITCMHTCMHGYLDTGPLTYSSVSDNLVEYHLSWTMK
jgi:hypothetical protein